jgi:hypothetical protein
MDTSHLINAIKSENLLAGSVLLDQIEELRTRLQYKSDGTLFGYDDYYQILQKQIEALPHISLQSEIAPHTESQYQVQLITALEAVFDDCERVTSKLYSFLSKLKVVQERMETLRASFVAWYALAAQQYLSSYDMDLSKVVISDLAKAEFERLIGGLDVEVSSLIEAVGVQIKTVNKRKQTSQEKFSLGKDQANAAWTGSLLPGNIGTSSDAGARDLLATDPEEPEEDVPAFVSKIPKISDSHEVNEIRGVFEKRGDPAPAALVGDEMSLDSVGTCMHCGTKFPVFPETKTTRCPSPTCGRILVLFPAPRNEAPEFIPRKKK